MVHKPERLHKYYIQHSGLDWMHGCNQLRWSFDGGQPRGDETQELWPPTPLELLIPLGVTSGDPGQRGFVLVISVTSMFSKHESTVLYYKIIKLFSYPLFFFCSNCTSSVVDVEVSPLLIIHHELKFFSRNLFSIRVALSKSTHILKGLRS